MGLKLSKLFWIGSALEYVPKKIFVVWVAKLKLVVMV